MLVLFLKLQLLFLWLILDKYDRGLNNGEYYPLVVPLQLYMCMPSSPIFIIHPLYAGIR